ncbi:helicase [Sphingomonas panacisoli]|uniref:Helicase n=1 Tax=Sphingomonas panacisoli TaxID=1813879 RepID=A0A5B8LJ26_9SPHN|nr:SNF2-related protein [Sphingomonas panacisoli]QDZ08218.1 helicase [Sphingomonas panacisoli]
MFAPGTIVRLRNDPACAGHITGVSTERSGRRYHEVQLADGSGKQTFPESQLVAASGPADPLSDLEAQRFADPNLLRRMLLHKRLTGRLRDVIYSMDVTDTEFHAYQFKPVVKLLASPAQGLLIADEVGLGKTIEAGLIWTELVARFDCHRLLVVCPKSLTEKWRLELWQKFSVDAKVVDASELLNYLKRDGEQSDGFALIVSLSSVRPPRGWQDEGDSARAKLSRFLADQQGQDPLFDCIIFDEAHHLRNAETMNHAFASAAMDVADYKLLLSATPINLRSEDLRNLLALLDPDTFGNAYTFELLAEENRPLVAARELALRPRTPFSELKQALDDMPRGSLLKIDRQLENLQRELADPDLVDNSTVRTRIAAQLEEMSLLGSVVNRTRRRDVNELQVKREVDLLRWHMSDEERTFYDDASDVVRAHAWSIPAAERFLLATPQRLIASSLAAACRHWARRAADLSMDDPDDAVDAAGPLVAKLGVLCNDPARLAALEASDTKFERLVKAISDQRAAGDSKLIIFSSFRVTLDYLADRLRESGSAFELMHGGVVEDRTEILARFAAREDACVLLTSEVGGEGLDMQFCRALINYDLPWNPMKVEQRIGRIDRIGQGAAKITILSLIAADTIEEQVYQRLYRRLLVIEQTLGAFESILGNEIQTLEQRLLDPELTPSQREEEVSRRAMAIEERHRQTMALEEEAPGLIAHGDMILAQIAESHRPERRVGAEELADYVHEAIAGRFPGSEIVDAPDMPGLYDVRLSDAAHLALKRILIRGGRFRTRLTRETRIRAAFERKPGLPKSIELVTTVHALVRLAATLRKEAAQGVASVPVVNVTLPSDTMDVPDGVYVVCVEHWMVDGAVRVDRIAYGARMVGGSALDAIVAEQMLQVALATGRPGINVSPDLLTDVDKLRDDLKAAFEAFVDDEEARHLDRAETGIARLERQHEKRVRDSEAKLWNWKLSGDSKKLRLIPAEQGKLNKLLARLDHRRDELVAVRDRFSFQPDLVGIAIVAIG